MDNFINKSSFDRRQFLRAGMVGFAAAAAVGQVGLLQAKPLVCPLGLDLFTLREEGKKDFPGSLKKVAEMGYKTVEINQRYGLKGAEIRRIVEDAGLKAPSSHGGPYHLYPSKTFAEVKDHWEQEMELRMTSA